jgi:hypothetical protein
MLLKFIVPLRPPPRVCIAYGCNKVLMCKVVFRDDVAPKGPLFRFSLAGGWIPFLLKNEESEGPPPPLLPLATLIRV